MTTRRGADGKEYPYNPSDPEYLSKYQIGFNGCFKCGSNDHYERSKCPLGRSNDRTLVETFMTELAIHKPKYRLQREEYLKKGMGGRKFNNQVANHYTVSTNSPIALQYHNDIAGVYSYYCRHCLHLYMIGSDNCKPTYHVCQ